MRNMAVLHSPAFSYPLPVLVRVLFNLLIFKGKILYYNKYKNTPASLPIFWALFFVDDYAFRDKFLFICLLDIKNYFDLCTLKTKRLF